MKILQVIPSVGPLRGGPSQVALDVCEGLAQLGVDVTLATTDDNGPDRLDVPLGQMIEQCGYKVIYFRRTTHEYTFSWSITSWLYRNIQNYDFVHVHAVFSYVPLVSSLVATFREVPYAITPHGILGQWGFQTRRSHGKRLSYAILERQILNRSRFVHATSEYEVRELRDLGVCAPIQLIYLGLKVPSFETITRQDREEVFQGLRDRIVLLFLSRFHQKKGLDLLLPAFAQAAKQFPQLVLAHAGRGDHDYESWLRAEVRRLKLDKQVIWLGFVEGNAKQQVLRNCDIFILPSYSESFGMAVVEAMAYAKPVIISDQVAIHDVVSEANAGLICSCQIQSLSEAILILARNGNMRKKMGDNGRVLVETKFELGAVAGELLRIYEKEMRDSRTPLTDG